MAFSKPRADLVSGRGPGLGPSSWADFLCDFCNPSWLSPLRASAAFFYRMGCSPILPTKELIETCFESKVRNLSENKGSGRIAHGSQITPKSSCSAAV